MSYISPFGVEYISSCSSIKRVISRVGDDSEDDVDDSRKVISWNLETVNPPSP